MCCRRWAPRAQKVKAAALFYLHRFEKLETHLRDGEGWSKATLLWEDRIVNRRDYLLRSLGEAL